MRSVGVSWNKTHASVMPYTGSRAKTTAAVRALITPRLATNRLCATPVQSTPSRPIHSQSSGLTSLSPGAAKGSRHNATTAFCHMAACTAGTRPELARLFSDNSENSNPEATDHSSPSVAWLARSKLGVTRISPTLTSTTKMISLSRMRSRKINPSRMTVNAGKLAKPRVAIATPAILTETKKLTQCPASSKPLNSKLRASRRVSGCQRVRLASAAKHTRASTAKAARPNTMIEAEAAASLPNTPVRPNSRAPICRAPRAVRGVIAILESIQARRAV